MLSEVIRPPKDKCHPFPLVWNLVGGVWNGINVERGQETGRRGDRDAQGTLCGDVIAKPGSFEPFEFILKS